MANVVPLPLAEQHESWAYVEKSELGADGPCELIYRVPVTEALGPRLPEETAHALALLLHEFDRQEGLAPVLERFNRQYQNSRERGPTAKSILRRILPRLVTYRYVEKKQSREFVFDGHRPSSVHVLSRVFESGFKFRLEDLSHFATHGEHLLGVLHAVGLPRALDPEGILYCPALDSPFPFKFAVVGQSSQRNRDTYVSVLKQLLRKTESDERFRSRIFQELMRGFEKFGPASATPQFQEVELKVWRLLSYLAARLRVKSGRLTDTTNKQEIGEFLRELRHVHTALDDLVHLPSRLAAFYRTRFDVELASLYEEALPALDEIAHRIDCDLNDRKRSIDEVAELVSEFRRLGSSSPMESLLDQDIAIKEAYGDVPVPQAEAKGWVRTYREEIFTGAKRFDTRRYQPSLGQKLEGVMADADFDLDLDMNFGFGGGGHTDDDEDDVGVDAWDSDDAGVASASQMDLYGDEDEEEYEDEAEAEPDDASDEEWELSDLGVDVDFGVDE